jgi:hypothetical protein
MKPGVKRDPVLVFTFVGGVILWFGLGCMLSPSVPPAVNGTEMERSLAIASQQAFMTRWAQRGMYFGIALIAIYCGFRALSGKEQRAKAREE